MVGDVVIIGFFMPFCVAESNSEVKNAKLLPDKTAITDSKKTFLWKAKVKQNGGFT